MGQVLGLINDQKHLFALCITLNKIAVQKLQGLGFGNARFKFNFKLTENHMEKIVGKDYGIKDNSHLNVCLNCVENMADKGGFTHSDIPGEQDKTHIFS